MQTFFKVIKVDLRIPGVTLYKYTRPSRVPFAFHLQPRVTTILSSFLKYCYLKNVVRIASFYNCYYRMHMERYRALNGLNHFEKDE